MTTNKSIFTGTGVALVTPFNNNKKIDFDSLSLLVNHVIDGGLDFLVVMGTTGESVTISDTEQKEVLNTIIETNAGRLPIVLGIGGNNTLSIVEKIKNSDFTNISGILSVSPYYNKPTQEGIYQHYKQISEASPVPIILYNVPARTSSNISADTTLRLANDFKNIVAIKEASGDFGQIMKIINNKPDDFLVISGDDVITLPLMSIGVCGVISVIANAYPKEMSSMVNFAIQNNFKEAENIHYKLLNLTNSIFEEGNPAGVKALLELIDKGGAGVCKRHVRLPLVEVSDTLYQKLSNLKL